MGKGLATLCLLVGGLVFAAGLDLLPAQLEELVVIDAPPRLLAAGGFILSLLGFLSLARDHRVSETITSLGFLAIAGGAGWLTFVAPEGTINRYVPFIPQEVNEALARLLFGFGAAVCIGMAIVGFRRLMR